MSEGEPESVRRSGRGGRVKGAWTVTDPDGLRQFRKRYGLSRVRLGKMLGVSPTTVQNWETGADVASPAAQEKIAAAMKDAPAGLPIPRKAAPGVSDAAIETTGTIVDGYLRSLGRPLTKEELLVLIDRVRLELS